MTPLEVRQRAGEFARVHEKEPQNIHDALVMGFIAGYESPKIEPLISETTLYGLTFEAFWHAYDKKRGKDKAEKLWNKLTLGEKQEVMEYIPLYKQAQPDKQYRKDPQTFLRNKSWNDELIFSNNGQSNSNPTADRLNGYARAIASLAEESDGTPF